MKIAYLSPSLPTLSETFVYEELNAVEAAGINVLPISVHVPAKVVVGQEKLASRVRHLYVGSYLSIIVNGLLRLPTLGGRALRGLCWLASDILECGFFKVSSWKLLFQFFAAVKLAKILLDERCEHLHVHFADTPGQIAMYASVLSGVPFTIMAHANDIFNDARLLQKKAKRSKKMLTISEFNIRYLESVGVDKSKLGIVRCGVSFSPPVLLSDGINEEQIYRIGSLGRMVEKKGFDVLINAVALVFRKGFSVELTIAGDGPLANDLAKLVEDLGISHIVRFTGSLTHDNVSKWMRSLNIFVLACKVDSLGDMDGIPVVLMEAMSQNIPVISTKLSGIPELVKDGETGILVEPNDAHALARGILRLIDDAELNSRIKRGAALHVYQEFGQAVNVDRLVQHIQN